MKTMKKLACLLLALVMIMALGAPAMAAEESSTDEGSITLTSADPKASYTAYRIFDLKNYKPDVDENTKVDNGTYVYTLNEDFEALFANGAFDAYVEFNKSGYVTWVEGADAAEFAKKLLAKIEAGNYTGETVYTGADGKASFTGLQLGYYLVSSSAGILCELTTTNPDVEIKEKNEYPTLDKTLVGNDGNEAYVSDSAIGDEISYRLTAKIPEKYNEKDGNGDYIVEAYFLKFIDKLSAGLDYNKNAKVWISDTKNYIEGAATNKDVTEYFTIRARVDETEPDAEGKTTKTGTKLTVTSKGNLKENTAIGEIGGKYIIVTYTANLNENAVIGGTGNINTAKLWYSNDPASEDYAEWLEKGGDPDDPNDPDDPDNPPDDPPNPGHGGETPEKKTVTFTYKVLANKIDDSGKPVPGASFTLYVWNQEAAPTADTAGIDTNWTVRETIKAVADANGNYVFDFSGLDAGTYKLVESEVPDGYNKADDIIFKIVPEYELDASTGVNKIKSLVVKDMADNELTDGVEAVFTADTAAGSLSTNVVNVVGALLPSTGGIGTTIFTVVGIVLMLGAAILLVTKKRTSTGE